MHELNVADWGSKKKISKARLEAFEDRKRQQAREIKLINDEIMSKFEELDLN